MDAAAVVRHVSPAFGRCLPYSHWFRCTELRRSTAAARAFDDDSLSPAPRVAARERRRGRRLRVVWSGQTARQSSRRARARRWRDRYGPRLNASSVEGARSPRSVGTVNSRSLLGPACLDVGCVHAVLSLTGARCDHDSLACSTCRGRARASGAGSFVRSGLWRRAVERCARERFGLSGTEEREHRQAVTATNGGALMCATFSLALR